jgi:hypothetical protein
MSDQIGFDIEGLALVCLAHFEKEEAMLDASLQSLCAVRDSLVKANPEGLNEAVKRQQHAARLATELAGARRQLRERMGQMLGVPVEQVSLRMLAERVSGEVQQRLWRCRERLAAMARKIERINRGNIGLIRQSMDLMGRLLESLGDDCGGTSRYTSRGEMASGGSGSCLQTQC